QQLEYLGIEPTPKQRLKFGILPGQVVSPELFRSRYRCPRGCGRHTLRTRACWSNVPVLPHTPHGRLDLYARRRALINRRNQIEAWYSALKSAYKLALDGPDRTRTYDRTILEALIATAVVTHALLILYDARSKQAAAAA